jgi:ATP-binding cassette subfamily F protein 3
MIIKNLTVIYHDEPVFEQVSFSVSKGDVLGIVGPNGAGKTTLLKTILGDIEPDKGYIERQNEKVGYVPQDADFGDAVTIADIFGASGAHSLEQAGLASLPRDRALATLSGGQKTRLKVASVLRARPTLLLLDEPTNHLDAGGIQWLTEFVRSFSGGVIVVSHDRAFLDAVCTKVLELDSANHTYREYKGNYTAFQQARAQLMDAQMNAHEQHTKEKKRLEERVRLLRERASIWDDPAHGKRLHAAEKHLEREEDTAVDRPREYDAVKHAHFSGAADHAKLIVRCTNVTKSYDGVRVVQPVSFEIRGNERVLLAGPNGAGKTTLLRMVMQDVEPSVGEVMLGANVRVGYFAQEHESLDSRNSVLDEFLSVTRDVSESTARRILGRYLFRERAVFKRVSQLSLGERARLAFAKLLQHHYELLLLDEPTNHLDIATREVIEDGLKEYTGAMIVVSHDAYFIKEVGASRTIVLTGSQRNR